MNVRDLELNLYDALDEMSDEEFIELWNNAADDMGVNIIFPMSSFNERFADWDPIDIARSVDSQFSDADGYFFIDEDGTIVSLDDLSMLSRDKLVDTIIDTNYDYDSAAVYNLLQEVE